MVSRRKRANSSVANKLSSLTDKVTAEEKLQQVSGTQTNAVTNDSIALGAVNTESVTDRSITSAKIGRGEVTSENLGVINEIVASGGLDIETGVEGHLSLSGGKYEAPYDGIEDADGYKIVAFDPTNNTVKIIDETPVVNLDNILDVDVTGATDNQVLAYDEGTSTWGPATITHTPPLDDLSDVTITSASVGQTLLYNSSGVWVNSDPPSDNYIINGAFDIWQRGTSISVTANATYTADRWIVQFNGSGATRTISQQTFTPGAAPVSGYEGSYFLRFAHSVAGSGASFNSIGQRIEDVRTLAGQTVTVSFWAKATSTITIPNISLWQVFGTGGSSAVETQFASSLSIGTSWTRYSYTVTLPSISGKTIGTSSYLQLEMYQPLNQTFTFDLWGVQVEEGSVATPFRRNAPNPQAELAACQRYYVRFTTDIIGSRFGTGMMGNSSTGNIYINSPVMMRVKPSSLDLAAMSTYNLRNGDATVTVTPTAITLSSQNTNHLFYIDVSATVTTNQPAYLRAATTAAYLGFSAEL